jgi:hypothetical protein
LLTLRDPEDDDVGVYPNSLNRHLIRMREAGAINGLPYFSRHLVRAAICASVVTVFMLRAVLDLAAAMISFDFPWPVG